MINSLGAAVEKRAVFSLRYMMWVVLALYATTEFYPVNTVISLVSFFGTLALALVWLLAFPATTLIKKSNIEVIIFFGLWLSYSMFSYIWAIDRELALDHVLLIFRYMCVFLLFDALARDRRIIAKAHLIMVGVLVLYVITALWEMLTFQHLPSSQFYGMAFYYVPTGPFFNPNNLAAFMIFILPFLIFLPKLYRRTWIKPAVIVAVSLVLIIISVQGARIAMLATGALLMAVVMLYSSLRSKLLLGLLMLLAIWGFIRFATPAMQFGYTMIEREISSISSEADSPHMSSLKIRKQMVVEATNLAASSGFMGVGGGNFEHYMNSDRQFRTAGIVDAHNWFMEILGNYGLTILMSFIYIYLRWLWLLWVKYRISQGRDRWLILAYIFTLLMFIPVSALPSSIRWNFHIWIIFAAINAFCFTEGSIFKEVQ